MTYLLRLIDSTDPGASLKHAAYAVVVSCGCGWLSWEIVARGMSPNWVAAFTAILAAVTAGKIAGSKAGAEAPTASDVAPAGTGRMDGGKS